MFFNFGGGVFFSPSGYCKQGAQEAEGGIGHLLVRGMWKPSIYGHNGWDEDYDSCMGLSNRSFLSYFPFIFSLSLSTNAAVRRETEPKK